MPDLYVRNWARWQTYRSDRGLPPWIKIHRRLMRDPAWVDLTDAQRGQLVAIWLLAADRDGWIPSSPEVLQKLCFMHAPPDLKLFIDKGFLDAKVTPRRRQGDATPTPRRRQRDAPKAEAKAEAKAKTKEDKEADSNSGAMLASSRRQRDASVTSKEGNQEKTEKKSTTFPLWIDVRWDYIQRYGNDEAWKRYMQDRAEVIKPKGAKH